MTVAYLAVPSAAASGGQIYMFTDAAGVAANPDSNGVKWGLFDLDGWNNGVDVKPATYDRPFQDGATLDRFTYAARMLTLHGGLVAPTAALATAAVRELMQGTNPHDDNYGDALRTLSVVPLDSAGLFQTMGFRRSGSPIIKPSQYGKAYEFQVPMIAPDPRKYAAAQSTATASPFSRPVSCTSLGNIDSFVQVVITGPITNPVVTHNRTGWTWKANQVVPGGGGIGFDTKLHTTGPYPRSVVDVASQWFPILPGVNLYTLSGSGTSGATAMTVSWYDAWE